MARVLVEHGADVNRRDSEGKTVMMVRRVSVGGIRHWLLSVAMFCQVQGLLMCVPPHVLHVCIIITCVH